MSVSQRSRYSRPLKATHSFTGPVTSTGSVSPCATQTPVSPSPHSTCSSLPTSPSGSTISSGRRVVNSPERRSPVPLALTLTKGNELTNKGQPNPRRSNSMGSLSDPDSYMNSLWPRVAAAVQIEAEEVSNSDTEVIEFSHKRSSSCSSADRITKPTPGKAGPVPPVHSCMSIEGLNQEISLVLEGKPIMMSQHPDGHIAPVRDLLGHLSVGTQTPPTHHSSPSPHPSPLTVSPSSQLQLSHTHTPEQPADTITGTNGCSQTRESPATPDYPLSLLHPPSPKPSFAREPPDGAERCVIKQETRLCSADFIQKGPDRSKANIIFKGTAFAPLLTTPSLPVTGIQC